MGWREGEEGDVTEMQQLPLAKLMFQIKDFHKGGPFRDNIELDKQTDLKRGQVNLHLW